MSSTSACSSGRPTWRTTSSARAARRRLAAQSVHHHRTDRLAALHQLEAVVDVLELEPVRDQRVDLDLAVHVPVDDLRHVAAATRTTEGRALPHAPGHELERPCRDLLPGGRHADDHADAPALVAALERLAHRGGVADA